MFVIKKKSRSDLIKVLLAKGLVSSIEEGELYFDRCYKGIHISSMECSYKSFLADLRLHGKNLTAEYKVDLYRVIRKAISSGDVVEIQDCGMVHIFWDEKIFDV